MALAPKRVVLLMAEDDDDDFNLAKDALQEVRIANQLQRVNNGEELIEYLEGKAKYSDRSTSPLPNIIFLDLNMPKMDGREALAMIEKKAIHRQIPIVIMTTSQAEQDIFETYKLGANSYVRKPVSFAGLVDVMKSIGNYWFTVVELPNNEFVRQKS